MLNSYSKSNYIVFDLYLEDGLGTCFRKAKIHNHLTRDIAGVSANEKEGGGGTRVAMHLQTDRFQLLFERGK